MNPEFAQSLFDLTKGLDPLFATVDGANSPTADMSTLEARTQNTSMLREKGLFRISLKMPANAEFTIDAVDDPYRFANATEISAFRRPLPASNLRFLSTVMWDGREALTTGSVATALRSQVKDAVIGHMQALYPPTEQQITQIVDFEMSLFTTQIFDSVAGSLDTGRVHAGPETLLNLPFVRGINRMDKGNRRLVAPSRKAFGIFVPWREAPEGQSPRASPSQQAIARGEQLFNRRPFAISGVPGFNDKLNLTRLGGRGRNRDVTVRGNHCFLCAAI